MNICKGQRWDRGTICGPSTSEPQRSWQPDLSPFFPALLLKWFLMGWKKTGKGTTSMWEKDQSLFSLLVYALWLSSTSLHISGPLQGHIKRFSLAGGTSWCCRGCEGCFHTRQAANSLDQDLPCHETILSAGEAQGQLSSWLLIKANELIQMLIMRLRSCWSWSKQLLRGLCPVLHCAGGREMLTGRGSLTDHFDKEKIYFILIKSLAGNINLMPTGKKTPNK